MPRPLGFRIDQTVPLVSNHQGDTGHQLLRRDTFATVVQQHAQTSSQIQCAAGR